MTSNKYAPSECKSKEHHPLAAKTCKRWHSLEELTSTDLYLTFRNDQCDISNPFKILGKVLSSVTSLATSVEHSLTFNYTGLYFTRELKAIEKQSNFEVKVKCIILPDYTFFLEHVTILLLRIKNNESVYFFCRIPFQVYSFNFFSIFTIRNFSFGTFQLYLNLNLWKQNCERISKYIGRSILVGQSPMKSLSSVCPSVRH